jgi:hypothetical protein
MRLLGLGVYKVGPDFQLIKGADGRQDTVKITRSAHYIPRREGVWNIGEMRRSCTIEVTKTGHPYIQWRLPNKAEKVTRRQCQTRFGNWRELYCFLKGVLVGSRGY